MEAWLLNTKLKTHTLFSHLVSDESPKHAEHFTVLTVETNSCESWCSDGLCSCLICVWILPLYMSIEKYVAYQKHTSFNIHIWSTKKHSNVHLLQRFWPSRSSGLLTKLWRTESSQSLPVWALNTNFERFETNLTQTTLLPSCFEMRAVPNRVTPERETRLQLNDDCKRFESKTIILLYLGILNYEPLHHKQSEYVPLCFTW